MVSLIVPCYNEEEVLPLFFSEIDKVIKKLAEQNEECEIIFADDGSKDKTLSLIKEYTACHQNANYISFSRNFGKESAMLAGYRHAQGDYIAAIDADLQHPPELIFPMLAAVKQENYDCCGVKKDTSNDKGLRNVLTKLFYRLINRISTTHFEPGACDYQLMNRNMLDAVLQLTEHERFTKGILGWIGFRTKWITYVPGKRQAGESKWSIKALFNYALTALFSFSFAPLFLPVFFSFLLFAILLVLLVCQVFSYKMFLLLFFLSQIFVVFSIAAIAMYLKAVVIEEKGRPQYIVKESTYA